MKKVVVFFCVIFMCLSFSSCLSLGSEGKTDNVVVNIGSSNKFGSSEIDSAVECVLEKFKNFRTCELTDLWYDESKSNLMIELMFSDRQDFVDIIKENNVIVLISNFDTGLLTPDTGFNADSTYPDWMWILVRDGQSDCWMVYSYGY